MTELGGFLDAHRRLVGELLDPRDGFFGLRRLFHALADLGNLRVHRPDHLVHAVGLHDSVLHGLLLAFERLRLPRHVLGQGVQRVQPFLGALR